MTTAEFKRWLQEEVHQVVMRIDNEMTTVSPAYAEMAILAASFLVGAREAEIADGLEYDKDFVQLVGSRLRTAKIWVGDEISENAKARWSEEDNGGVAFMCDVNVARGSFIVARYDAEEPMYSLSASGDRDIKHLLSRS